MKKEVVFIISKVFKLGAAGLTAAAMCIALSLSSVRAERLFVYGAENNTVISDTASSGDVNNDGNLSISDAVMLQKWLLNVPDSRLTDWNAGDMCEDGKINVFDLIMINRLLIQQNTENNYDTVIKTTATDEYLFKGFDYSSSNISLPFREVKIGDMKSENVKLIIYLHGGHSCGTDNMLQLEEAGLMNIADYLNQNKMNAILVAPQCNTDHLWTYKGNKQLLKSFIDNYVEESLVSDEQIYIFGASAGGTGTWNMIADYPGLFRAAMPAVSSPQNLAADVLCKTPVCVVLGEDDVMFPPDEVEPFLDSIKLNGGEILYQIRQDCKHPQACESAFTTECIKWVLDRN